MMHQVPPDKLLSVPWKAFQALSAPALRTYVAVLGFRPGEARVFRCPAKDLAATLGLNAGGVRRYLIEIEDAGLLRRVKLPDGENHMRGVELTYPQGPGRSGG